MVKNNMTNKKDTIIIPPTIDPACDVAKLIERMRASPAPIIIFPDIDNNEIYTKVAKEMFHDDIDFDLVETTAEVLKDNLDK